MATLKDLLASGQAVADGPPGAVSLRSMVDSGRAVAGDEGGKANQPIVGPVETYINDVGEALPFGRTVTNAVTTAALQTGKLFGLGESSDLLTDKAKAEMAARGMEIPSRTSAIPGVLDTYRQVRGERAQRVEAGADQNKVAHYLGTGTGVGLSLVAPALRAGAGLASRLAAAGGTGAAFGAAFGADHGRADLTRGEFGQLLKDMVGIDGLKQSGREFGRGNYGRALLALMGAGGVGGGLTGVAAGVVAEAAQRLGGGELLRRLGIRKGRDVLQGGSDIAAPTRTPLSDDAVEEVLRSGDMGGTTAETYQRIENRAGEVGAEYGRIVRELEERGVRGPEARQLADQLMERYRQEWVVAPANKAVPEAFANEAANMEAITGPPPGTEGPAHTSLGLSQAEGLKQRLQTQARYERLNNNATEEARQEIASIVRQANEDAIAAAAQRAGPGSEIAEIAADFIPTKQRLGRILEARTAAERGAVKAAAKPSGPGLPDLILGATTGNPATAYLTAMASRSLRSRIPSMISRGAYGSSQGLASGAAGAEMAKFIELLKDREPTKEEERASSLADILRAPL